MPNLNKEQFDKMVKEMKEKDVSLMLKHGYIVCRPKLLHDQAVAAGKYGDYMTFKPIRENNGTTPRKTNKPRVRQGLY